MKDYEVHTFPNGLRLVHKQVTNTKIAHCGFVLDIGSRDELDHQQGIAHFWEHMAFKGTTKRRGFHICNRLEAVGGELNAYTTKEKICFYASVLESHHEKAVELLCDITFDSIFPEKEIDKERSVILEEMSMYLDTPDDAIADEFDTVVFGKHPLGNNILGTNESVRRFTRPDFRTFIAENLNTERMVFASVGNFTLQTAVKRLEKHIGDVPAMAAGKPRQIFTGYTPMSAEATRPVTQAHSIMGSLAYPINDERRLPLFLMVNLLGGSAMNSRLNLSLREKHGLVYSIEAGYQPYVDTGLFSIYFATEASQYKKAISLVHKELKKLREQKLGTSQLHTAKQQMMGQLAMSEESNLSLMLMLGKSLLDSNKIDSLNHIFSRIEGTTAEQLQDIAVEVFNPDMFSSLTYQPEGEEEEAEA
ncbi:MAG: pitrilysin family protein [Bacteroidota bacterium]